MKILLFIPLFFEEKKEENVTNKKERLPQISTKLIHFGLTFGETLCHA